MNEENVKKLIETSIERPEEAKDYNKELLYLYDKIYREVLFMKFLDPIEAGCDIEGLKEIFLGEPFVKVLFPKWRDEIISKLGEDEIINELGKDRIINKIGEDEIISRLGKKLGKKKLQELLDKLEDE